MFMMPRLWRAVAVAVAIAGSATAAPAPGPYSLGSNRTLPQCRYLQPDPEWPHQARWDALNASVSGRLISTVPLAAVCHAPHYDAAACAQLSNTWPYPQTHFPSAASIDAPYFQNESCNPFTPSAQPCVLGNLVSYSIDVSTAQDVVRGLDFCRTNNIRPVIKNTGHDFLGRSTGPSGLGFWTHHLKSIEFVSYQNSSYRGPAMKVGAGVQIWEAFQAAAAHDVRLVGGDCPTLALAGGFTQGGGHGPLSSTDGLSADNVLEWELVTAGGQHLVATPTRNSDLYWALSGGGGGNFGVVLSMTLRVYPDGPIGAASLSVPAAHLAPDDYWAFITSWHAAIPALVDQGATTGYLFNAELFDAQYVAFPNRSAAEVRTLLAPVTNELLARNISYSMNVTVSPTYVDFVGSYIGLPYGNDPTNQVTGSRLIPRSVVENDNDALTAAVRAICADPRFTILAVGLNVDRSPAAANAVLPAWRDTTLHLITRGVWNYTDSWETNLDVQSTLTNTQVPHLEAVTPGSGSYMNEGNFDQPDWQDTFYGSTYKRLSSIKNRYDPDGLLYVTKGAGSEKWNEGPDGRLCRTASS